MKMERVAEIVRGWPYDGALDRHEPIKAGTTVQNGDWVEKVTGNVIDKVGASLAGIAGLVIQGNADSASGANTGRAVVLWGNFIGKFSNATPGAYVPGSDVTVKNGKLALAAAGDRVVGTVLDVVASGTEQTAHIVVKVA